MRPKPENRYQFQPWYTKTYRWLRFKPVAYAQSIMAVSKWIYGGAQAVDWGDGYKSTRYETFDLIWSLPLADADFKMGHYYTSDEVFGRLRD